MDYLYIKNRKDSKNFVRIKTNLKFNQCIHEFASQTAWKPVYSDAYSFNNGVYTRYRLTTWQFFLLFFFSYKFQVKMSNGMIWYPFATKRGYLSFSYRSDNGFTKKMRHKQAIAVILAGFVNFFYPFKRPILIFEKLSERAQESGFSYFKYVSEKSIQDKYFFLIKRTAHDFEKVSQMNNIVIHGSFKHFYLLIRSKLFISSETPGHSYFWRENMGYTANIVKTKPYVFLQHGVLGFKKLDNIFYNDRLTAPVCLITSSQFEQDIVTQNLGYAANRSPITGLARWDLIDLKRERTNRRDKILLFYTWRPWLDDVDDETFDKSEYLSSISESIQLIKQMNLDKQIVVMMHPKMHIILSKKEISSIKLWTDSDGPLNELMSSVALLITDYSSLAWEAYYREIPVIFDMFDQQRYEKEVGSYIDLNRIPFGSKVVDKISDNVQQIIAQDYQMTEEELQAKGTYFAFQDQNASQRIHDVLQNIDLRAINRDKRRLIVHAAFRIIFKR